MSEILPVLQGLSTPVLVVVGWLVVKGNNILNGIDKRVTIIEFQLKQHRLTEEKNECEDS